MKLSNSLKKAMSIPTDADYKKMEEKYIKTRLVGKRRYGMKKLMKDLYVK